MAATQDRRRHPRREEHQPALRRREGADRHQLRRARARDARHHRPQRRRQELDAQLHQRRLPPQEGSITFRGKTFKHMNSRQVAEMGIARTFQNLALFKGMSVLDNIMTGRNLKMKTNLFQQAHPLGRGRARGDRAPRVRRADHRLPRDPGLPQDAGRPPALRPAEARRPRPRAGDGAAGAAARRADGRHERRGEAGHEPLHPRRQRRVRHHHRADRARHGRGDGHLRPRGGARLRQEDRRRHARRGAQPTRTSSAPTSARATERTRPWASSSKP